MRISELGEVTGVPVHTLKYYLREGLVPPGLATSRTRAEYGEAHVERVRLVRALVDHGGVGIAGVRAILDALEAPPPSRHDLYAVAACAMPTPAADHPVDDGATALVEELGWQVAADTPALRSLSAAVRAAGAAGVGLSPELLRDYVSSKGTLRKFCSHCGTRIAFESEHHNWRDEIHLPLALFVTPVDRVPTVNSFPEERPPWAPFHAFADD